MTAAAPYYRHHVLFCLNARQQGAQSCGGQGAQEGHDRCKRLVREAGLSAPGQVRVNAVNCLNRCAHGPVAVVYPEGAWYSFVDGADIDEIVASHLLEDRVVQRLLLPADEGPQQDPAAQAVFSSL